MVRRSLLNKRSAQDSKEAVVWCALPTNRTIGPFFFYVRIVTEDDSLHLLNTCALQNLLDPHENSIIREDENPLHHNLEVREVLDSKMTN